MSTKQSKNAVFQQIGAKASTALIFASVCAPVIETVAYAETVSSTQAAVTSQTQSSFKKTEVVPQTVDTLASSQPKETESNQSSESVSSSTAESSTSSTISSSSSNASTGSSSQTKPSTTPPSTTKPSTTKPSTTKPSTTKPSTTPPSSSTQPGTSTTSSSAESEENGLKPKVPVVDGAVSYSKNQTTEQFIAGIGKDAGIIGDKNNLYASVMIAQAILESASGNSSLAREPNFNLFGIKGSYKGQSIGMPTLEDDGKGNMSAIRADFRKYPSYKESLEDYAILIKGGTNAASSFYKGTWKSETTSYREATAYLTGRYATDTRYNQKLNGLIETYDLQRFDNVKKVEKKFKVTSHKVSETDSLWKISKKYGTTINSIKKFNKMSDDEFLLKTDSTIIVKRELVTDTPPKDKEVATKNEKTSDVKKVTAREAEKEQAKEVILIKASQLGHAFKNAVPSVLYESKTFKVAGKRVKSDNVYYVGASETLNDISKKVGVPLMQLIEWNFLEDSILTEGQALITESPLNSKL